ncbi:MAG: hypothetical protein Kow0037_15880 [Calditrichia bacterium]
MSKIHVSLLSILSLLLLNGFIFAQSNADAIRITDNLTGIGARALGMGGAYSAVADDYSATYWNPAGLAQMRKMEFWMGLSNVNFENDATYNSRLTNASTSATKFNSIGMVFPVPTYRGSLVFSFGYQRLKDFDYINNFMGISSDLDESAKSLLSFELDESGTIYPFFGKPVEKSEWISDEGTLNQFSIAGAVDVSPQFSIGAVLNFWTGSSDYQLEFQQEDAQNQFNVYPADFNDYLEKRFINSDYSSLGLKLSGLYRVNRKLRLGMGLELPQSFSVEETYKLNSLVSFDPPANEVIELDDYTGETKYDVKIPFRFFGGASYAVGPVLLAGGVEYFDWTQVKFDADNLELTDQNRFFKLNYRSTMNYHLGAEIGLPFLESQLRAGYFVKPSPLKDAKSDEDRKYFTLGYGLLIDRIIKLDFAFIQGGWKQFSSDEFTPEGTAEDINHRKLIFTFSYRF